MLRKLILGLAISLFQQAVIDCPSCIVVAQTAGTHSNTLTWAASASTVTGYNVYKFAGVCAGTPLASFTKVATNISALTFTDSGLADGATNCYFVTAVSATGESQSSGTLQLTSPIYTANTNPGPPGKPVVSSQ
jgi:hypothetical protein